MSAMKSVTPSAWQRAFTWRVRSGASQKRLWVPPGVAPAGRTAGSCSTGGSARVRFQVPSCRIELGAPGPLALPGREVGVLDRQVGQRGRPATAQGAVDRRQFLDEHALRPAVGDDVVHRDEELVVVGREPPEPRAHDRAGGERPRTTGLLGEVGPAPPLLFLGREIAQVGQGHGHVRARLHVLPGHAVDHLEPGPEHLVPGDDLVQAPFEQPAVERSAKAVQFRAIERSARRRELREEPEPLLGKGERKGPLTPRLPRDGAAAGRSPPAETLRQLSFLLV